MPAIPNTTPEQRFEFLSLFRWSSGFLKVIQHQAIAVDLPGGLFTALLEGRDKPLPVLVVAENALAMVTAIHDETAPGY